MPHPRQRPRPPTKPLGFTLIEFVACLAIVSLLAAAGWPGWSQSLRRHQVQAAANNFTQGMADARLAATDSGQNRYLVVDTQQQCQAVTTRPDCACHESSACLVKVGRWVHGAQVQVRAERHYTFTPTAVPAQWSQPVTIWAPDVPPLEAQATPLGRARVCAPQGGWSQYAHCLAP